MRRLATWGPRVSPGSSPTDTPGAWSLQCTLSLRAGSSRQVRVQKKETSRGESSREFSTSKSIQWNVETRSEKILSSWIFERLYFPRNSRQTDISSLAMSQKLENSQMKSSMCRKTHCQIRISCTHGKNIFTDWSRNRHFQTTPFATSRPVLKDRTPRWKNQDVWNEEQNLREQWRNKNLLWNSKSKH